MNIWLQPVRGFYFLASFAVYEKTNRLYTPVKSKNIIVHIIVFTDFQRMHKILSFLNLKKFEPRFSSEIHPYKYVYRHLCVFDVLYS